MVHAPILVINTGSSSLKFGLYAPRDGDECPLLSGSADGIGQAQAKLELKDPEGKTLRAEELKFSSQSEALERAVQWLAEFSREKPVGIGHRVVHGGPRLLKQQRITSEVLKELKNCVHFAPLHIPAALQLIEKAHKTYPGVPQFACFDTAFHTTIPEAASRFPLPGRLFDEGIHRYGFHGLSYESIVYQLGKELPSRTVMAHLGSGASLCAVKDGRSIDTSMGLTPTGGIPMATRSGELDPGVLLYLMRVKNMDADSLEKLLNHDSGLLGLSGGVADMRELEKAAGRGEQKAQLAIEVFCVAIRKYVAAYSAVMGGLDMLVFAGGIGEHSATVRGRVCDGLKFLGVDLNEAANEKQQRTVSTQHSKISVRVVGSQEDEQIARHCRRLLG